MGIWLDEDTDKVRGIVVMVLKDSYGRDAACKLAFDQAFVDEVCARVSHMHRFDDFLRYEVEDVREACDIILLDIQIDISPS